ncbi:BolA family protein [Vibrio aestuarianus]|uniref:BolA family protein n=1 Tax=Vibrio aestuarianus TaxID=28171 RepID=UPI0014478BE7|nr:BolA/IbaG family iron-sulfur metabolism protein [Vibrio aestuarianus]MDE1212780.1 BolA/IbaG family iron-sulfur metabolism protein [Vibrio aestuarianus]MDE1216132.1 BolA/IbaG family iron-sulfur metabolism protein [Vibrio aestuarianus]MDE1259892.1 BolA/IbaG family iron-sulfur metabolism protein [Vibrio aestuarianus]MDE1266729.1 BolA/IbaG family iron-sulfur metabolism protein [Vibrio aestuarianus]MDE1274135.1 BolA/IbaG family iron-sulfur metabolism protein [Vibrio aestuarianus]
MIQSIIEKKLHQAFNPDYLNVENESYMHNVPAGSESHFKVIIASELFEGARLIARHRQVNQVLAEELASHIHALSMHTYTPQEWKEQTSGAPDSPMCMGGGK